MTAAETAAAAMFVGVLRTAQECGGFVDACLLCESHMSIKMPTPAAATAIEDALRARGAISKLGAVLNVLGTVSVTVLELELWADSDGARERRNIHIIHEVA